MTFSIEAVTMRADEQRARIEKAGGDLAHVKLLAVTKGFSTDAIRAAVAAGLGEVGENYAQEAKAKHDELVTADESQPRWHFIGRLQKNKVRQLASFVDLWQSVDSLGLADEIAKRAPGAEILVQVDLAEEPGRGGCSWNEAPWLVEHARQAGLVVRGLMGVGPPGEPEVARPAFRRLATLANTLEVDELSMGMTNDLEVAVQEGATIVRIGRALFGQRLPR